MLLCFNILVKEGAATKNDFWLMTHLSKTHMEFLAVNTMGITTCFLEITHPSCTVIQDFCGNKELDHLVLVLASLCDAYK